MKCSVARRSARHCSVTYNSANLATPSISPTRTTDMLLAICFDGRGQEPVDAPGEMTSRANVKSSSSDRLENRRG
jgi:hypothetical protein